MKFGLLLTSVHSSLSDARQQVKEHRELVRMAGDLGFELIVAGQHYAAPSLRFLQPVPYLASLAVDAGSMEIATGIILLPLQHPLAIAEEIATLDVLTDGRAVFGVGIGYARKEFEVFGVDRGSRTALFEEQLEIIKQLWTGEPVTFDGDFYQFDDVQISTVPLRKPHPPIWIGAQAESSVRRAARLADAWYAAPFPTHRELLALRESYGDECARVGRMVPAEFPVRRELVLAETRAEAERLVEPVAMSRYSTYANWGMDVELGVSAEDWRNSRFLLGDAQTVAARLGELAEDLAMSQFILKVQWPGWDHRTSLGQLEKFGTEVLPLVRGMDANRAR